MDTNSENALEDTLKSIKDYPYLRECFSGYLRWLFEECDENRRKYDRIFVEVTTGTNRLDKLEKDFREFGSILDMDESNLCRTFRYDVDRNKNEILKVDDLLAESWVALSLHNLGFHEIRKVQADSKKLSDFTGYWNSTKFAIEVKNVRPIEDVDYHIKFTNAHNRKSDMLISRLRVANGKDLSQQEEEILPQRLEYRLRTERERKKIEEQLANTQAEYNCQATMLVICLDMLFVIDEFPCVVVSNLEKIKERYSISDYFACCINRNLFCTPPLP